MTIETLRGAYEAQPFKPFVIHLADGRKFSVSSREFIIAPQASRTFVVYQPDGGFHLLDLLLVTGLEFGPENTGKKRRRTSS